MSLKLNRFALHDLHELLQCLKDLEDRIDAVVRRLRLRAQQENLRDRKANYTPRAPDLGQSGQEILARSGFPILVSPRDPDLKEHLGPTGGAASLWRRIISRVFGSWTHV